MKKNIFMVVAILLMYGCASIPTHMSYVSNNTKITNSNDYATIVFFRPANFFGSAIPVTIIEIVNNENVKYVGQLFSGAGVLYKVKSGKYTFGISGEIWKTLEVNTDTNKFYYIAIYATPGVFQANFATQPIKDRSSLYITHDIKYIKWTEPNENAKSYIMQNANSYYASWLAGAGNISAVTKEFGISEWFGVINK